MEDVMLDLETMGSGFNAAIVQIGACYFDRHTGEIGATFLVNIDLTEELKRGFETNASTISWWLEQDNDARSSICGNEVPFIGETALNLNSFLKKAKNIWSHATFDFVILMNHFAKVSYKPSFHYRTARDLRTLVDLAKIDYKEMPREGTHHNALADCKFQVKYAVECFKALSI